MFQRRGISASLASRLSRGEKSFNRTYSKFKATRQDDTFQSSNGLHARLGNPVFKKKSVHSRLTMGSDKPRILQAKPNIFLKSIEAMNDDVMNVHRHMINRIIRKNVKDIKSKSNSDEFLPVRINNGAVVKGLRSDQLLLQKDRERKSLALDAKREKLNLHRAKEKLLPKKSDPVLRSSKVSMDFNSGLTVSFNNDAAKKNRLLRAKPSYSDHSDEMSVSSSDDEYPVKRHQRPALKTDVADEVKSPLLRIGIERPPPPKPHRQVLDPKVQKEIAALQGRVDSPHSGPGPGVKNFRMIPSLTRYSLSERFTIERTILE